MGIHKDPSERTLHSMGCTFRFVFFPTHSAQLLGVLTSVIITVKTLNLPARIHRSVSTFFCVEIFSISLFDRPLCAPCVCGYRRSFYNGVGDDFYMFVKILRVCFVKLTSQRPQGTFRTLRVNGLFLSKVAADNLEKNRLRKRQVKKQKNKNQFPTFEMARESYYAFN